MKLKTNNAIKQLSNTKKNKSAKKQTKGVVVRKEKSKDVVKPTVLKKEAEKDKVDVSLNPHKILQQELWSKAILNVSNMSNLSDEEESIAKLLSDYKKKSSIPQKRIKLKNFITKGFSKFKDTSDEVLEGIYDKIFNEFKAVGGVEVKDNSKTTDSKIVTTKSKKKSSNEENEDEENDDDNIEDDVESDNDNVDDDVEDEVDIELGDSDNDIEVDDDNDDVEEESEEEKPKIKAKGNKANNKNGSKFKGGKIKKNKKFGKK